MSQDSAIYLVPLSLREANDFLAKYGRSYRPMRGCKFCVGCALDGKLAGAVIAGRCREDGQTVQIDRVYATGGRTAYGMLYGAAARAAQALGYWRIIAFLPEGAGFRPASSGLAAHGACGQRREADGLRTAADGAPAMEGVRT